MQNKKIFIIVGIVILAGALYVFLGLPQELKTKVATVKSADGVAVLEIPDGALPEGITMDKLSIVLDADLPPYSEEDGEKPRAYKLLPDGLQLAKPAKVSLTFNNNDKRIIPFVLHISGEGEKIISEPLPVIATFDAEKKKVTVTGEISHFSRLEGWEISGLFEVSSKTKIFDHKIGEPFDYVVSIRPTGNKITHWSSRRAKDIYSVKQGSYWKLRGLLKTYGRAEIIPTEQKFDYMWIDTDEEKISSHTFTCVKPGAGQINGEFNVPGAPVINYTLLREHQNYSLDEKGFVVKSSWSPPSETDERAYMYVSFPREDHKCNAPISTSPPPPPPSTSVTPPGGKYYKVTSEDKAKDTGNEVCASVGKTCVGYTDLSLGSCLSFHPGANQSKDLNGSRAGFFCNGGPQGGICAKEVNTCHICPECNLNMECSTAIGDFYRETYVECK